MNHSLHLREWKCWYCGLYNRYLPWLLSVLFIHGPQHLKTDHRSAIFTQNDIIYIIGLSVLIYEQGPQSLSRNVNRSNNRSILPDIISLETQCLKIDILLGRQYGQHSLIQKIVDEAAYLVLDKLMNGFNLTVMVYSKHLALLADNKNIAFKNILHHITDIIKNHLTRIIVMQQFAYLARLIK